MRVFTRERTVSREFIIAVLRPALVGWVGVWFCLGGCASRKDVDVLRRQLGSIRSEMTRLEKDTSGTLEQFSRQIETDSQPIRRNQAALGVQLDRMEVELGRLTGQVEEATAVNDRQGKRISEIQESQMASILEVEKSVDDLERRLSRLAHYLGLHELAVSSVEPGDAAQRAPGGNAIPAPVPGTEQGTVTAPGEVYGEAFQLFRAGKFEQARAGFTRYLGEYPKTDLADNAQFWLGECYYAEKDYREAITAYEKTIKEYPGSDKVSSALLKQGMAFLELGDTTAARILLKRVVKDYPDTNQAQIAQRKLSQIK
jgi:tol-pal system protein YbgF